MQKQLSLKELQPLIIEWAREKDLIHYAIAPKQRLKLLEEVGETAKAILNNDDSGIKDGIGDMFVVLVILAEQLNYKFEESLFSNDGHKDLGIIDYNLASLVNFAFDEDFKSVAYTLKITCFHLKQDLSECVNIAWNEIKNRTGKTVNGTFIKN